MCLKSDAFKVRNILFEKALSLIGTFISWSAGFKPINDPALRLIIKSKVKKKRTNIIIGFWALKKKEIDLIASNPNTNIGLNWCYKTLHIAMFF